MSQRQIQTTAVRRIRVGSLLVGAVGLALPLATPTAAHATYYPNCDAARTAGVAPIYRGQDGYASHLDRDGDGIACETGSSSSGATSGGGSYTGPSRSISLTITSAQRVSRGGVEVVGQISCYDSLLQQACYTTGTDVEVGVLSGGTLTSVEDTWIINDTFHADFTSSHSPGATFQARYAGDRFTKSATSAPYYLAPLATADRPAPVRTTAPTTVPTTSTARKRTWVRVKPVQRRSKLRVDVGPDGGPSRRFVVQKNKRGTWRQIGATQRAGGWRHIRTIDARKGVYRVKVKARPGYTGATSRTVLLSR